MKNRLLEHIRESDSWNQRPKRLGIGFTVFEVDVGYLYTDPGVGKLPVLAARPKKGDRVRYNNGLIEVSCVVQSSPINVGGKWRVQVALVTNRPEDCVEEIRDRVESMSSYTGRSSYEYTPSNLTLHYTPPSTRSTKGVQVKRPTSSVRFESPTSPEKKKEHHLMQKYDFLMNNDWLGFTPTLEELKELDGYIDLFRYKG